MRNEMKINSLLFSILILSYISNLFDSIIDNTYLTFNLLKISIEKNIFLLVCIYLLKL